MKSPAKRKPQRVKAHQADIKIQTDMLVTLAMVLRDDQAIVKQAITDLHAMVRQRYQYFEFVLVDNGSTDATVSEVRDLQDQFSHIRLLVLSKPHALEVAFSAALEHSIGDYVVLFDIRCDPPQMVPNMISRAMEGYDVVIGERLDRRADPWYQRPLIRFFYWLAGVTLGYRLSANASYFRVFSRRTVNSITQIRNKHRYLKYFNALVGFKQVSVPYQRIDRAGAQTARDPIWKSIYLAIDIILSNSSAPLRFCALLGLVASFINVVFIGYVFVVATFNSHVAEGWVSTSIMNATMFFLSFLILAVMSEYIARILNETKEQPLYFLAEEYVSNVPSDILTKGNIDLK